MAPFSWSGFSAFCRRISYTVQKHSIALYGFRDGYRMKGSLPTKLDNVNQILALLIILHIE
jgi:hypothetical protein